MSDTGWIVKIDKFEYQSTVENFTTEQHSYLEKVDCIIVRTASRPLDFDGDRWVLTQQYDLLDYFDKNQLDLLEKGAPVLIENRQEGHSYREIDYYSDIYYTIHKHGLNAKQFWYISSNLKEENAHRTFLAENPKYNNDIKNRINLFVLNDLNNVIKNFQYKLTEHDILNKNIKKSFCCFNHRPATHRIQLMYYLYKNKNLKNIHASCFKPDHDEFLSLANDRLNYETEKETLDNFFNSLPYTLDVEFLPGYSTPLFDTIPLDFYNTSAAALVTESLANDWSNTSLFYSEKTWKPMWYGLPVLIAAQREANSYLKTLGFELYTEVFDYEFDKVPDQNKRMLLISEQVKYINKNKDWKNWNHLLKEKILYNRNILEQNSFNRRSCQKFFTRFSKLNK
jgi:hypothetical protein